MYILFIIILRYPLLQNIFYYKKFQVLLLFFCFRQDRPTGPVDRRLYQDVHACARLSADRPGRPTVSSCSWVFWVDRPGRPPEENCIFS